MDHQQQYDALLATIPLPLLVGGTFSILSAGPAALAALCSALVANLLVGLGLFYRTPSE